MTISQILVRFVPTWEVEPETPKPPEIILEEGWIKWEGGECPIPGESKVEVILRSYKGKREGNIGLARRFSWTHFRNGFNDIVAYKVIE